MQKVARNAVALIAKGAPHRIHDEETLALYTKTLFHLTAKEHPSDAEEETIDLLTLLIEDYEACYRLPQASPVEVLHYLMEKAGLRQQDLRAELGSPSNISMILSGARKLTLEHASALSNRFQVDIRVFLQVSAKGASRAKRLYRKTPAAAAGARRPASRRHQAA